ncbi:MAG: alanine racemase [Actinomycetota bacterium]
MTVAKHVDLAAYVRNLKTIREQMQPARIMAVVKADAYGHGLVEVAKAAATAGINLLGVLDVETGLELRLAGVQTTAFAWVHSPSTDFEAAIRSNIELSASSLAELERIAMAPGMAKVHLKLDSGLSRGGTRIEDWDALVTRAVALDARDKIDLVAVWSHLSGTSKSADEASIALFDEATNRAFDLGFTGYRHIASSPAAFALPQSRYELVRIGVSAFGTSPIEGRKASSFDLECPMTVTAEVIAPQVISIGFLHGYFSKLSGKAKVLIGGRAYQVTQVGPLASKIEAGDYSEGDEVLVFGGEDTGAPTAEYLCELVETVTDEIFTGLKANSTIYSS